MQDNIDYRFSRTPEGQLTCSILDQGNPFWLHSRYNPIAEAERFAESQIAALPENLHTVIVYGIGCGHHIRSLAKRLTPKKVNVQVWEANLSFLQEVCAFEDMQDLVEDPSVEILPIASLTDLNKLHSNLLKDGNALITHNPSLRLIPDSLSELRKALGNYQLFWLSVVASHRQMSENFRNNLQKGIPGIKQFIGLFTDVPIILVAAGPSLQKNMMQLKQAREHSFIASVGTAWRPLMEAGIVPDFVMMTDPNVPMMEQIDGLESAGVPLFAMSTLFHGVLEQYAGPSFIVFQQGYEWAEQEASRTQTPLIETGGSVATSIFSLAQILGFSPICWVGLDLAYTGGSTHVTGAHRGRELQLASEVKVLDFERKGTVGTSRNLQSYLRWFEETAKRAKVPLFNATEGGAYIEGFQHITLQQFLNRIAHVDVTSKRQLWNNASQS